MFLINFLTNLLLTNLKGTWKYTCFASVSQVFVGAVKSENFPGSAYIGLRMNFTTIKTILIFQYISYSKDISQTIKINIKMVNWSGAIIVVWFKKNHHIETGIIQTFFKAKTIVHSTFSVTGQFVCLLCEHLLKNKVKVYKVIFSRNLIKYRIIADKRNNFLKIKGHTVFL